MPSIAAARFSAFSCPYGCSRSGGASALRTETSAITEATRSIPECTASVRIAIDPVIAPAAIFSAISTEFEAMLSIAARDFVPGAMATRAPRRACAPRAAGAARRLGERSLAAALDEPLVAVFVDVCERRHVGDRSVLLAGQLAQQEIQILLVGRVRAGKAGRTGAGTAVEGAGLDTRVVGDRGHPRRCVRRARLVECVLGERLRVLGRELHLFGQRDQLEVVEDLAQLAQLVIVARGHDDA